MTSLRRCSRLKAFNLFVPFVVILSLTQRIFADNRCHQAATLFVQARSQAELLPLNSWRGSKVIRGAKYFLPSGRVSALGFDVVSLRGEFVGWLVVDVARCLCDLPEKPYVYEIGQKLPAFFKYKGIEAIVFERLREGSGGKKKEGGRKLFEEYCNEIERNHPVVVTFLYRPEQGKSAKATLLRREGFSVVGVGYLKDKTGSYLIGDEGFYSWESGEMGRGGEGKAGRWKCS